MELDCPEFLKPRLRIFLSADIVGSTGLKQSRLGASAEEIQKQHAAWFSAIQGFYIEARQSFLKEWNDAKQRWSDKPDYFGEPPIVWKTIGDEVIFVKILTDYRQVAVLLKCWIAALRSMREFLQEQNPRLNVKSTAWLAGFPVENKEVVLSLQPLTNGRQIEDYYQESGEILNRYYSGETEGISLDFIGPAIDIGFRLSAQSSSRKFVLGVGIPYILALTNPTRDKLLEDFDVFYSGSVPLKGVLGGLTYPVFWIDMSETDSLASHEDRLTRYEPPGRDAIRRYCEAFYVEHSAYIFSPFIYSRTEQQLVSPPTWYEELHENLTKNFLTTSPEEPSGDEVSSDASRGSPLNETDKFPNDADVEIKNQEVIEALQNKREAFTKSRILHSSIRQQKVQNTLDGESNKTE